MKKDLDKLTQEEIDRKNDLTTKLNKHVFRTIIDGEEIFVRIGSRYHSCQNDWNQYSYFPEVIVLTKKETEEYISSVRNRLKELTKVM